MQRTKGKAGEREAAALLTRITGQPVQRRVRQHDGDSDLLGITGWSVEVKRHAAAPRASIAAWWRQAVAQCEPDTRALLLYRADRGPWRAVWAPFDAQEHTDTIEAHPALWWALQGLHGSFLGIPNEGPLRRVGAVLSEVQT